MVSKVDTVSKKFGLTINIKKTEVQVISREKIKTVIKIDGKPLEQVENPFTWEESYPKHPVVRMTSNEELDWL